ncbi:hypothetical protein AHF37_01582 [Paragonimus kellicotti]|nr:hypothetical protein AHF37_01582 [Paragonimus kellicotti]
MDYTSTGGRSGTIPSFPSRREKRLTGKRSTIDALNTEQSGTHRDHTMDNGEPEEDELTDAGLTDLPPHVSAKLHQIDAEIETLKRLGESSGITAVSTSDNPLYVLLNVQYCE